MAVGLAEVKAHLNITTSNNDAELTAMLARAQATLGERVGPVLPTTITDEVHTGPGPLVLDRFPVISVTSATSGGLPVTGLDLDRTTGELFGAFGYASRGVRVTYVAGWDPLPADLEMALLELVAHFWDTQRGGGSERPSFPGEADDEDSGSAASGYLLPYRVTSLLKPHKLPPSFG